MTGKQESVWRCLPLALFLSVGLLAISYTRIVGDARSAIFKTNILDSMFAGSMWGTALMRNLILFGLALLVLHLAFGVICWAVARLAQIAWPSAKATLRHYVLLAFAMLTFALLANNAAGFPRSSLGEPYTELLMQPVAGLSAGRWITLLIVAAAGMTCLVALVKLWREGKRPGRPLWAGAILLALVLGATSWVPMLRAGSAKPPAQPNVVLIGLDSLRRDVVAKETSPGVTPNLTAFMSAGVEFSNAMTPLARTFPSMTTILTGRHPHSTGAVMNLLPRDMIREGDTLGRVFKRAGYRTAYATDEVRFSNIDESFGFDRRVSPPIGSSEFLIAQFADTPLSNAVVNTVVGKWLFPSVHANRGAAKTYDPDAFLNRVESEVEFDQPLLLAVHLTLPHWPYVWADAPIQKRNKEDRWPEYYLHVVRRADRQFKDLMRILERKGVLRNAIVIVYSDHGESFGSASESLVPEADPLIMALGAKPVWGHGTSVLSSHQFRVVLGMRGYGHATFAGAPGRVIPMPVSVEDIAPTLIAIAGAKTDTDFDGRSLAGLLRDENGAGDAFTDRVRFTETEYQPQNLAALDGKVSTSALVNAAQIYRINPETDRIEVKRALLGELLLQRQYAAVGESMLLAAIPDRDGPASHRFFTVPNSGGTPQPLEGAPPPEAPAELHRLWSAMQTEFAGIIPAGSRKGSTAVVADLPVANPVRVLTTSVNK